MTRSRTGIALGGLVAAALLVAGCGGGGATTSTAPVTTAPVTTGASDPLAAGKAVFLGDTGCGGCHTLADAGSTGTVASNLDEKKPTAARVQDVVEHGIGAMPSFRKQLSAQEIADVAAYVAWASRR